MEPIGHNLELVRSAAGAYTFESRTTARDVAAVLFRRKRIILLLFFFVLAGAIAGAVWLRPYLFPTQYASDLKFILKKDRFDAVVTPADRAVPGLTTAVSAQEIQSEIALIKGADVLERLAREAGAGPLERLSRNLVVEPVVAGRNVTNLIAVQYRSTNPDEVVRVISRLPEIYLEKYVRINRRPAALEYFRAQSDAFEEELGQAEEDLAEFDKEQPALAAEGHQQPMRQKLAEIEKQKAEVEAAIRDAETQAVELARQRDALPAATVALRGAEESPFQQRLKAELLDLKSRRAQANFYRDIQELDQRIEEVRNAIAEEAPASGRPGGEKAANPLRQAIEAALFRNQAALAGLRARRSSLVEQGRTAREDLAASRLIAAENSSRRAALVRQVKTAEENFLLYRRKYIEAQEAENLDQKRVLNVSVAEGPRPPAPVEERSRWVYVAAGLAMAATVSLSAGFAAEALDHSVHSPRELENFSSLPVLACIPESRR
jgi:uncharacterized protein involved in exopolysaccharide biosynthesis